MFSLYIPAMSCNILFCPNKFCGYSLLSTWLCYSNIIIIIIIWGKMEDKFVDVYVMTSQGELGARWTWVFGFRARPIFLWETALLLIK
jgi:hypothetical protein